LIREFELKSGRDTIVELKDAKNEMNKELLNRLSEQNVEDLYKFWKNRRIKQGRSLLR